jgi:serine/threonine-protein kinase
MLSVGGNPNYIQVAPNGKFAYITNESARVIDVLNTATDQISGMIKIPQGQPQSVSFSPDSRTAYVSVYGSRLAPVIAFIDTATGTVAPTTVRVDNIEPGPSATSPDGLYLYVPNHNMVQGHAHDNVLDVIDLASNKVTDISVEANPHWVVFGKNGVFYVTDHMSDVVTVLNAKTNHIITTIPVGETPHSAALSPDGSRLAVTSYNGDAVFLINTATNQWNKQQIPVGREPLDIAYSPDGRYLFTVDNLSNTVTVIDTADNRVIAEIPTGKAPTSISVLSDGRQAYVTDEDDGMIEILNLPD